MAITEKGQIGMESAERHAGAEWAELAQTVLRWFLRRHDQPFTMEQVRIWATAHDLPAPPDARAWGAVTRRALSEGLIVATGGYRATAASNGGLKALYRKA